jgi:hypothetical protein
MKKDAKKLRGMYFVTALTQGKVQLSNTHQQLKHHESFQRV